MNCPACGGNVRFTVSVYIDASDKYWLNFSKTNLRSSDIKILGVNWDVAHWYCESCGQTWVNTGEENDTEYLE